ncbi:putative centrosomal protein Spd-2/CEP192 [Plasmopara halstedii]
METLPHSPVLSYTKRNVRRFSHRQEEAKHRRSCVGDEISPISIIEREHAYQGRSDVPVETESHQYVDDSFDLPNLDAFSPLHMAQETQKPVEDVFVDAAKFLEKNDLGGSASFSEDVEALAESRWGQTNANGRPSDFFESRSRNLEQVELSSPQNIDDPMFGIDDAPDKSKESNLYTSKQQLSPADPTKGLVLYDRPHRNSELSGSGTAYSSGYDVHFDNTRLIFTPNTLKHLQEKSRLRGALEGYVDHESNRHLKDFAGEAEIITRRLSSLSDLDISEGPSIEYVATLQKGPGVIKESLREIDVVIDHSNQMASLISRKNEHCIDSPCKFVQEYDSPLESMLPLSRTTDSWGEDVSVIQTNDDGSRQSRDLEWPFNFTEANGRMTNSTQKRKSQESPELVTIREMSKLSKTDLTLRRLQNFELETNCLRGDLSCNANLQPVEKIRSNETLDHCDQLLDEEAALQNLLRDNLSCSKVDTCKCTSDEEGRDVIDRASVNINDCRRHESNERVNDEPSKGYQHNLRRSGVDSSSSRLCYNEKLQSSQRSKSVKSQRGEISNHDSRITAGWEQPNADDSQLSACCRKRHADIETAMVPRRCRRLLCSIGDIMTEQIIFTNGTDSVGRICISLLPLSTGCQQFSVSPAVLELGPKASNAFHVTFNARYAGAVSGIFQFRGIGIESLFHPYEVVIEASVKRHNTLEDLENTTLNMHDGNLTKTSERVQELHTNSSAQDVEAIPTFIRFDRIQSKGTNKVTSKAELRLSNNTAQMLSYEIRTPENLWVRPAKGVIESASEVYVSIIPISQPFVCDTISIDPSSQVEDWFGSLTVKVGKSFSREVSVVVDRQVLLTLPPFDEIARSRHRLSSQTDSFYYTKRGKRRGLYFHARAVEFGCCNVGESHEVPVYVCNGSNSRMTVFLQDLQDPFSCAYTTTTIEPRKFIEVMVSFTPKVVGKVATSLFAYSVTDKAVVTLVARGM